MTQYHLSMEGTLGSKLTYEDYTCIPADGKIYQILDGDLIVTPAPGPFHQRASKRLQRQLEAWFEEGGRGEVFNAPIDVILSPHDIVQPDLVVVTNPSTVTRRAVEAPPALVVEVISPSSVRHDRQLKAVRYAALGIPHYWILDADARALECYRAEGGRYVAVVRAEDDATLTHPDFPGLTIALAQLWR